MARRTRDVAVTVEVARDLSDVWFNSFNPRKIFKILLLFMKKISLSYFPVLNVPYIIKISALLILKLDKPYRSVIWVLLAYILTKQLKVKALLKAPSPWALGA